MSYKPKYCCQCGEKVERIDWKFWHSHRFCELCSSEYRIYDLILPATGFFSLLILFFISIYFQRPEKPLNVSPNQFLSSTNSGRSISANQNIAPSNMNTVQIAAQTNVNALPVKSLTALKASDVKTKQAESSAVESVEKVYFCGAPTKKGTPCSRRVRGGGRCWQHIGQPALLAQEKLLAAQ